MPRYFTTYWRNDLWERKRRESNGGNWVHTSANNLRKKGIRAGDCIYVVTVISGRLYLAGRIEVGEMLTRSQAEDRLGRPLYAAGDHVLAREGSEMAFDFETALPVDLTKRLRFIKKGEAPVALLFKSKGLLDQQTLRSIRELTAESAGLLDDFLVQTASNVD
jgi:hypothetical protein